jgi:hypothetical protein
MAAKLLEVGHEVINEDCEAIADGDVQRLKATVATTFVETEHTSSLPACHPNPKRRSSGRKQSDSTSPRSTNSRSRQYSCEIRSDCTVFLTRCRVRIEAARHVEAHYTDDGRVELGALEPLK